MSETAVCLFCHEEKVPLADWNKRCPKCKEKQQAIDAVEEAQQIQFGKRQPAVIVTEGGQRVFVDKFGKDVDNPGYDLDNDPRGWGHTGSSPSDRKTII